MSTSSLHRFYWLPNALTLGRIFLIPLLMWAILAVGRETNSVMNVPFMMVGLFVVCAVTDFLDGYLARKWDLVSDFGRMLDPIADKLLVAGCLIALNISYGPVWFVLVPTVAIIFRDIFISGTREHAANASIVLPPTNLAKWKTAAEMLAIFLLLISLATNTFLPVGESIGEVSTMSKNAGIGFLWLAALLSLYTGLHYVRAAFKR